MRRWFIVTADRTLEGIGRFAWERVFERVPTGTAGIKPTTKYVGWVLARYADADTGKEIWPGRKRLAAVVGKSLRTIDSALNELCDVGLIEVVRKGGRGTGGKGYATEYRLCVPDDLTRKMQLLDLDGGKKDADQSQPIATDEADQSQLVATDAEDQSQFPADQSQLSHASVATLDTTSRKGLHPINHSYINQPFINQGASAGNVTRAHAGARCEDHPTEPATKCRSCKGDVNCGDREPRFIGRHQPRCSLCDEALIGHPPGATTCHGCTEAATA